jgi:hypothetical protein
MLTCIGELREIRSYPTIFEISDHISQDLLGLDFLFPFVLLCPAHRANEMFQSFLWEVGPDSSSVVSETAAQLFMAKEPNPSALIRLCARNAIEIFIAVNFVAPTRLNKSSFLNIETTGASLADMV